MTYTRMVGTIGAYEHSPSVERTTDMTITEAPEAPADETPDEEVSNRKASMPTYTMTRVDAIPDEFEGGRANLYFGLLSKVAMDPGEWYEVAHFRTPAGARNALNSITPDAEGKTERAVPEGEWEFRAVRVQNTEDPTKQKHSKLFARFLG